MKKYIWMKSIFFIRTNIVEFIFRDYLWRDILLKLIHKMILLKAHRKLQIQGLFIYVLHQFLSFVYYLNFCAF